MLKSGRYRHFKGNEYELLATATHSETGEPMAVYRALYGERGLWVRPAAMWEETLDRGGVFCRRFEYVGAAGRHIRLAGERDIDAVAAIYDKITAREAAGLGCTGWKPGIYPARDTAENACADRELYVLEQDGVILATARLNGVQDPAYAFCRWQEDAPVDKVFVLHTLAVDPDWAGQGLGREFLLYYEAMARAEGKPYLRLDTNVINRPARTFYASHGYREAGIVPCEFNGLPNIDLVCLEKKLK